MIYRIVEIPRTLLISKFTHISGLLKCDYHTIVQQLRRILT